MKTHRFVLALVLAIFVLPLLGKAQETEIERPPPPASDDLEKDANHDGVPDGWYNARDAVYESRGGKVGPHFIRFECQERAGPRG